MVAVAMPSDDIEIFSKIVKKEHKDRYITKSTNDKENPLYFIAYGDKNTTFFILSHLDTNKPHGIIIRIYPIRKSISESKEIEKAIGIRVSIKNRINKFIRKNMVSRDKFYVRYGLDMIRYAYNFFSNIYHYISYKYPKAIIKEELFDIFGRNSPFTDSLITLYRYIYSAFDKTYFFFKNLRKHPFIETWDDLNYYSNAQIINRKINTELLEDIDKIDVDGIDVNLPGSEFFVEVFGENYEKRKVKFKPLQSTVILDTEVSYQKIIRERRKYINEIKAIQRDVRKTRYKVINETHAVNNVFRLVQMTDLQIKYQRFFDRRRKYLFSLDMDDEEEFIELYNRLIPIINNLRKYSEYNMTFSIDEEADSLIKKILVKTGEEVLVNRLNELSKFKYFVE